MFRQPQTVVFPEVFCVEIFFLVMTTHTAQSAESVEINQAINHVPIQATSQWRPHKPTRLPTSRKQNERPQATTACYSERLRC